MSRSGFTDAAALLGDLLDRIERKPGVSRVLAYIDEDGFRDVDARDLFVRELEAAERCGGIEIVWRRTGGVRTIAHIRLADAPSLYAHVERQPASQRAVAGLSALEGRLALPLGGDVLLATIAEVWARGKMAYGIAPHDYANLETALSLARALADHARDEARLPTDYRSFSRAASVESKALERLTAPAIQLFGNLYPENANSDRLDSADFLATLGIIKMPQPLMLGGAIAIDGSPLPPLLYHGVPIDDCDRITLAGPVDFVLTIENYTSFVRYVRDVGTRGALVIYTAGFPPRRHLSEIVRLAASAEAPVLHWGDIDGGGLRIFFNIERALAARNIVLQPHMMEAAILAAHGVPAPKPVRNSEAPDPASAIAPLWQALAALGLSLEQESLAPRRPELG